MQQPRKTPQIGLNFAKNENSGCILNLKKIECEQCIFQDFIVCQHFASNLVKEIYIESEDDTQFMIFIYQTPDSNLSNNKHML